ncbi:hypothetical protein QQZ08_012091 [Neonectria magnoliae]|uniref:Uncharacterized protein n=1 Tax=Neonectria magnoliae TaxID=2732573 RepID=A0ABR1H537_9HYPO
MAATLLGEARVIEFTTIENLFEEIRCTVGDMLHVHGVSAQQFAEIDKARGERSSPRFHHFDASSKTLIITIPTPLHECLHQPLWQTISYEINRMGLFNAWLPMGSPTLRATQNSSGDGGESDSSGGPDPERSYYGAWPTLAIEVGYSQTLLGLRKKMKWWFSASDHQVKIVLLARFEHERGPRSIIIEKYVEVPQIRPGATMTRAAARAMQLVPTCTQAITITENPSNPLSYNVTRGALRLEFHLLFLRQPRQGEGEGEGDIVISIQQLQAYAARFWHILRTRP